MRRGSAGWVRPTACAGWSRAASTLPRPRRADAGSTRPVGCWASARMPGSRERLPWSWTCWSAGRERCRARGGSTTARSIRCHCSTSWLTVDDAAEGADLFHGTLTAALIDWSLPVPRQRGLARIALAGGCLMNGVLAEGLTSGFATAGVEALLPRKVPANDGGLSLGQAWVAAVSRSAATYLQAPGSGDGDGRAAGCGGAFQRHRGEDVDEWYLRSAISSSRLKFSWLWMPCLA